MILKITNRIAAMNTVSQSILRGGLMIAVTLLICSALYLLLADPLNADTYELYKLSDTLREIAPVALFLTVIPAVWLETQKEKLKIR
jgi:hypothetical protein